MKKPGILLASAIAVSWFAAFASYQVHQEVASLPTPTFAFETGMGMVAELEAENLPVKP